MKALAIAVSTAAFVAVAAAAPLPALALQDKDKCIEAKANANQFDIKTFCPRSEWPAEYSGAQAKAAVKAPIRAFLSVFR